MKSSEQIYCQSSLCYKWVLFQSYLNFWLSSNLFKSLWTRRSSLILPICCTSLCSQYHFTSLQKCPILVKQWNPLSWQKTGYFTKAGCRCQLIAGFWLRPVLAEIAKLTNWRRGTGATPGYYHHPHLDNLPVILDQISNDPPTAARQLSIGPPKVNLSSKCVCWGLLIWYDMIWDYIVSATLHFALGTKSNTLL